MFKGLGLSLTLILTGMVAVPVALVAAL